MKHLLTFLLLVLTIGSVFGLSPKKEYSHTPTEFGLNATEVDIPTKDKANLKGWFLAPAKSTKKLMVICHDGEGNMGDHLERAGSFLSMGYHVLMFDYRGYGGSSDFKVSETFYIYAQFSTDVAAALSWCKKYKASYDLDLYGFGIGGGLALAAGANNTSVNHVIADGAYSQLTYIKEAYEDINGSEIMMPFGYEKSFMEPFYAFEAGGGKHLKGIMLIASLGDGLVTIDDADELYAFHEKKTTVFEVDSDYNADNFEIDKDTYFNEVRTFLTGE